ncbi:transportin MOS14 isoform X2 [Andrographis paniculata]|uniref:transportin MOS14 isoform X2 n=1 Tax=Andrographis paniculata TaxID=175694 RepID=UPI0021E86063|nr:transportin MOS14 isoform X2 [Andrographis paniculata]
MELHIKVAQAVHVLNHDSQSCNRIAANQWLVQFQQTDAAWDIATSLLTSNHHPLFHSDYEVEFFAAQILRRKIQNEGHALHLGAKDALLQALLVAAKRFSTGPPQLLTQICLALSTLVLHAVEHGRPIEKLFYSLQNLRNQDNGNTVVLEVLTVLPEIIEDQSSDHGVDSAQRLEYEQELLGHTPMVFEFLMQQFEFFGSSVQTHEKSRKILRCLLSWVRAGCLLEVPPGSLSAHPLFDFIFSSLQVASTFDLAVEVLVELVGRQEGLPQVLLSRIGFLKEALLFPALKSRDEAVVEGLAWLMSEIGQAAPFLIVDANIEALALADALLSCVAFPSEDWKIADSTLHFWSSIAGYIHGLQADSIDDRKNLEKYFIPIFSALVEALILRVQVDDSTYNDNSGNLEVPAGLDQFRMNLVELLVEICQLLGAALFIQKIFIGSWIPSSMDISWREIEAKLFIINALVVILSSKASADKRGFMCLVYKSLSEVVGSYAKWMSASPINTRQLILFLGSGISQPFCSSACALAFRKFCEEAAAMVNEPSTLEILIWIAEGLEKRKLALEDEDEVVGAITLVFCCIPETKLMKDLFVRLLCPSYKAIQELVEEDLRHTLRQSPSTHSESIDAARRGLHRIGTVLNCLATHCSTVMGPEESIVSLLEVLWPMLEQLLLSSHIANSSLSVAACRTLTLAVQASGQNFQERLPKVLESITSNFMSFQSHECYIRAASVIVEEFGSMGKFGPLFISAFERFTHSTSVMALTSSYVCDQEPDLVEAYTNFTYAYVCSCPKEVLAASGPLLEVSLQKAGICCTALHRGAALSAMSYMICFLEIGLSLLLEPEASTSESVQDVVIRVISHCGEGIISNLVYALLGVSAMSRVQKSATILQQLAAICSLSERTNWKVFISWEILQRWLYSALWMLPAEYLKDGEVESLVPIWVKALVDAASDYLRSRQQCGEGEDHGHGRGYMQGKGGRFLKRLLREFADNHRNISQLT